MIGERIGACAIGVNAAPRTREYDGIPAFYAADMRISALLSAAVLTGAVYRPAQTLAAYYTAGSTLRAVYQHEHILPVTADTKDNSSMFTHIHSNIETRSGETEELVFHVADKDGNAADLTGAAAEYRIARRAGDTALLSCTSADGGGIVIEDNAVTVTFDTAALTQNEKPLLGDFFAQLRITVNDRTLVVAEGPISIAPVVLPAL